MDHNLSEIYALFNADGSFLSGNEFGSGHIHDTFRIITEEANKDNYILQRLNGRIFKNINQLQHNIEIVTEHLREKLLRTPGSDIRRECLQLVDARDGKTWVTDKNGNNWRMFVYITDHTTYDVVDSPEKAYEGGRAIGKFQAMLSDLPGSKLYETIPYFHDVEKRLESFYSRVNLNPANRVKSVTEEIEKVHGRAEDMRIILKLGREGKIPLRITHNDTKFNNILLDKNGKALCVIDLDTVMPGYVHYDFGDSIRTATNPAMEDETDLSKVTMNIDFFRAYSEGYLSETSMTLNKTEKDYLAFSPRLITFIMALRFLTDYIDGDNYYKIHHPGHNLDRARSQLRLLESMEDQYSEMKSIIKHLG